MHRGEIWWATIPGPQGTRPVLILSREKAALVRTHLTVAPVSRTIRNIPVEVPLDASDGMPKPCAVNLDSILTISKSFFSNKICLLRPEKLHKVAVAVKFALGLE